MFQKAKVVGTFRKSLLHQSMSTVQSLPVQLRGIEYIRRKTVLEHPAPFQPQTNIELTSSFFKKRPGYLFDHEDAYNASPVQRACLESPEQRSIKREPDLAPQLSVNFQPQGPEKVFIATESERYLRNPPDSLKASGASITPLSAASPFRQGRYLPSLVATPFGAHANQIPPVYTSPAGRIATNNKHKVNEKHRRDQMGAIVQAIDIMGKDIDPGKRAHCIICTGNASQHEILCVSPTKSENITATAMGSTFKKTKNDILHETLKWKFSAVLHLYPNKIGSYLDNIRALAEQMAREKEIGIENNFAKSSKWTQDVRAETLEGVLGEMVLDCARHGVNACACGKHSNESRDLNSSGAIMTPPSSVPSTSPVVGQKRSREAHEEDRMVRPRAGTFFARL
jgi:hypothetical protein